MKLMVSACFLSALSGPVLAETQQFDLRTEQHSAMFSVGADDRQEWEAWIDGLSGDSKIGALYWAGQRSKSKPGSCLDPAAGNSNEWIAGCVDAHKRLSQSDIQRKSEPEYRAGWNSLPMIAAPKTNDPVIQETSPADLPSASFVPSSQGKAFLKILVKDDIHHSWSGGAVWDYNSFGVMSMHVEATKLFQDYTANEISADSLYLGKSFVVRGTILGIKKNLFGSAYLELDSSRELFTVVQANLRDDMLSEASSYQKGQQVELVCVGSRMMIGSPILSQCGSKMTAEAQAIRRADAQIDNWLEMGDLPTFITGGTEAAKTSSELVAFGGYWLGSRISKNSSCLSTSPKACFEEVETYLYAQRLLSTISEFRSSYLAASSHLKLLPVNWGDINVKARQAIAMSPADYSKKLNELRVSFLSSKM